ncbi:ferritin heavy chain, partial [Tropilaelaps mercedesae]
MQEAMTRCASASGETAHLAEKPIFGAACRPTHPSQDGVISPPTGRYPPPVTYNDFLVDSDRSRQPCAYSQQDLPTLSGKSLRVDNHRSSYAALLRPRQNFHEDCENSINKQINMELYASYVYLSMELREVSLAELGALTVCHPRSEFALSPFLSEERHQPTDAATTENSAIEEQLDDCCFCVRQSATLIDDYLDSQLERHYSHCSCFYLDWSLNGGAQMEHQRLVLLVGLWWPRRPNAAYVTCPESRPALKGRVLNLS